ncbi:MAG: hypothetical protein OXG60_14905, partial [Chloroflexi bacterium]|nr:hypothetical protein [Chloroflexota bacterium]
HGLAPTGFEVVVDGVFCGGGTVFLATEAQRAQRKTKQRNIYCGRFSETPLQIATFEESALLSWFY